MFCLACNMPSAEPLCRQCRLSLAPAPEVLVVPGLVGVAGFLHTGAARRLVHALKYRAVLAAAGPLADAIADRMPASVVALVPVPRATVRTFTHGIDPARSLAEAVARRTGRPVVDALRPRLWWRRHAGKSRSDRSSIAFAANGTIVPAGAALVDDVLTTGATAAAAHRALKGLPTLVLVATCASRVKQGEGPGGGAVTVQPSSSPVERTHRRARTPDTIDAARPAPPPTGHGRDGREHE